MGLKEIEKVSGIVENIVFSNEDTGFTVIDLDMGGELITAVGVTPVLSPGEEVTLSGSFTFHAAYGRQFRFEVCDRTLPATAGAIRKYLASGAIKGIGPKTAVKIVARFGENSLTVIENSPEQLTEVAGISLKKAREISGEYKNIFGIRSVMAFLAKYNIDPAASIKIWKEWGNQTVDILKDNPYRLCQENIGVAFEAADCIGLELLNDEENPKRITAAVVHILIHNMSNGHTCLPYEKLVETAVKLLDIEVYKVEDTLEAAIEENTLIRDEIEGDRFIYLPDMYECETYIAGRLSMMLSLADPESKDYNKSIDSLEETLNIKYAAYQRRAISAALNNRVFILTGGPGTGKTTTLNAIITLLEAAGEKVALAAPTGRAAKRMSEVCAREAKTIHRLLEVDFKAPGESVNKFKRHEKNPLRFDTIILDEVSMVDTRLLHSLIKAMKMGSRIIFVGDPDQLPSVGAGNILKDLIDSDIIPMVHLNEIFRQEKQSSIVVNAHQIVRGDNPDLSVRDSDFFFMRKTESTSVMSTLVDLCAKRLPAAYGFSPLWDIQVIAPSRVGAIGTVEINKLLQEKLNPKDDSKMEYKFGSTVLREKDKVMQIRNNYDIVWTNDTGEEGTGIFNGDIGIIEMIDKPSRTMFVRYDDKTAQYDFDMISEIEHAYAVTVHKSQGSEFEAVIMPLMRYHPKLYYRNILYTAVTRAKKIMIILGEENTVYQMVANYKKVLRFTNLKYFLAQSII